MKLNQMLLKIFLMILNQLILNFKKKLMIKYQYCLLNSNLDVKNNYDPYKSIFKF